MWNDQAEDAFRALAEAWIDGDEEALETTIREAELHELVEIHRGFHSIATQAYEEMEFRHTHDQKLAAGDEGDRAYVRRHAE